MFRQLPKVKLPWVKGSALFGTVVKFARFRQTKSEISVSAADAGNEPTASENGKCIARQRSAGHIAALPLSPKRLVTAHD
jgi:hypothetical protein